MRASLFWTIAALSGGFIGCASAEDVDLGQLEYQSNCAACHGVTGKGALSAAKCRCSQPILHCWQKTIMACSVLMPFTVSLMAAISLQVTGT